MFNNPAYPPPSGMQAGQAKPKQTTQENYGEISELEQEIERDAKMLFKKKKLAKVEAFIGYHSFMTNDFQTEVYHSGHIYPSVSYAFQAARAPDENMRNLIKKSPTLIGMYDIAKTFQEPSDWPFARLKVMEALHRDKFRRSPILREKLLSTGDRSLNNELFELDPEGENIFWGLVDSRGQNQLGRILEQLREDIISDNELDHWLFIICNIQDDLKLVPRLSLDVEKEGAVIEKVTLVDKAYFLFGSDKSKVDYPMLHPSISRRHACILHDRQKGVILIDLGSKAGTQLNGQAVKVSFPYTLKTGDEIKLGMSSRIFKINIDYSYLRRMVEKEQNVLAKDLRLLEKLDNPDLDTETLKTTLGLVKQDTIYIGGLAYGVREEDLEDMFADCGKIKSIRLPYDTYSRRGKGFAFITYDTEIAAKRALHKNGLEIFDRKIKVSIADKKAEIERELTRQDEEEQRKENTQKWGKGGHEGGHEGGHVYRHGHGHRHEHGHGHGYKRRGHDHGHHKHHEDRGVCEEGQKKYIYTEEQKIHREELGKGPQSEESKDLEARNPPRRTLLSVVQARSRSRSEDKRRESSISEEARNEGTLEGGTSSEEASQSDPTRTLSDSSDDSFLEAALQGTNNNILQSTIKNPEQ